MPNGRTVVRRNQSRGAARTSSAAASNTSSRQGNLLSLAIAMFRTTNVVGRACSDGARRTPGANQLAVSLSPPAYMSIGWPHGGIAHAQHDCGAGVGHAGVSPALTMSHAHDARGIPRRHDRSPEATRLANTAAGYPRPGWECPGTWRPR